MGGDKKDFAASRKVLAESHEALVKRYVELGLDPEHVSAGVKRGSDAALAAIAALDERMQQGEISQAELAVAQHISAKIIGGTAERVGGVASALLLLMKDMLERGATEQGVGSSIH